MLLCPVKVAQIDQTLRRGKMTPEIIGCFHTRTRVVALQDLRDHRPQVLRSNRFPEKVDRAKAHRLDLTRHVVKGRNDLAELRNVVERAVIFGSGAVIQADNLAIWPGNDERPQVRLGARVSLETIENEHIRWVLAHCRTVDEAAEVLGIDPATLCRRKKGL